MNPESDIFTSLEICACDLSHISKERVIESEKLENFKEEFKLLHDKVNESDINKELKYLLLNKIKKLLEIIENYQFFGSEAIKEEIGAIFGSIFLNHEKITKSEEVSIVKELIDIVSKLFGIANNANNLLPEVGKLRSLIPKLFSSPPN